ncbi:type II toxin-antitoxin system RelE family toxin [Nitratifractor sp.]
MYRLQLSDVAIEDLKGFNQAERILIGKKLRYLSENYDELKKTKKVTELKGTSYRHYRFVIARKIRAIFEIENDKLILLVLKIGRRKDVYG